MEEAWKIVRIHLKGVFNGRNMSSTLRFLKLVGVMPGYIMRVQLLNSHTWMHKWPMANSLQRSFILASTRLIHWLLGDLHL
jgi:hypothetical protein